MNIKLFTIDLDGTLLDKRRPGTQIRKKNLQAIKMYIRNGGVAVISTGRAIWSAMKYVRIIDWFCNYQMSYISTLNGAIIYDLKKKQIISLKSIPQVVVWELLKLAIRWKVGVWLYYQEGMEKKTVLVHKIPANKLISCAQGLKINQLTMANCPDACKINIIAKPNKLRKFKVALENNFSGKLEIARSGKFVIELTAKTINKGYALTKIAQQLNISLAETGAIGDQENDFSAINIAKYGVWVAKSQHQRPSEKSTWKIINSNGLAVAIAIENLFKNKGIKNA